MDFQILRRGIKYVGLAVISIASSACAVDSVRPCFTVGAPGNTTNQIGFRINSTDSSYACNGDISTDLFNAPFPMNDNTNDPNIVELPYANGSES